MVDAQPEKPETPDDARAELLARRRAPAPTIYDIARLAGVNPSTVSRALNKPGRVSAKTERRIHDAARELDYRVNPIARALPTGRTNTIGLIVADITNPMFFDIVRGAEHAASLMDYTLVLVESEESTERERVAADRLLHTVDGIVLATSRLSDKAIVSIAGHKPVVVINREVDGIPGIVADVDKGVAEAVRHLVGLGHRSIVYVAGPEASWMSERRWQSIRQRCEWSKVPATSVGPSTPTIDGGRSAAASVRSSGATAVIAYNDLMAIGLMQELAEAGLTIPNDLSILGFDDIFGSDFTTPPLSTIKSPLREEGELAVRMVLAELDGATLDESANAAQLQTRLIVRGSTGVPRA